MFRKVKNALIVSIGLTVLLSPAFIPVVANAAASVNNSVTNAACQGADQATGSGTINLDSPGTDSSCIADQGTGTSLGQLLNDAINILSLIVGAVSVIMIIIGGFKYITSGGNDSSVAGAKNTIIYALIGLVIVALAQIIVHFVLTRVAGS